VHSKDKSTPILRRRKNISNINLCHIVVVEWMAWCQN